MRSSGCPRREASQRTQRRTGARQAERRRRRGEEAIVDEAGSRQEKARRVLQAAAVEAYGRPETYVLTEAVMWRTSISEVEEFRTVAEYLERKGWIAEGGEGYEYFVVTPAGIDEATR